MMSKKLGTNRKGLVEAARLDAGAIAIMAPIFEFNCGCLIMAMKKTEQPIEWPT